MKLTELLNERVVVDKKIQSEIDELGELTEKIEKLKKQMKPLQKRYGEVAEQIMPVLDKLDKGTLETKSFVMKILRRGYDRENYKYKESFLTALDKVNKSTQKILMGLLTQTKSLTKINPSFSLSPLGEGVKDKLEVWTLKLMMLINKFGQYFNGIRDGNKLLKRLI